jgi:hypothetical protein
LKEKLNLSPAYRRLGAMVERAVEQIAESVKAALLQDLAADES